MSQSAVTSTVEIRRVVRVPGQETTLLLELLADGNVCDVAVRRGMNPMLFDFIAKHALIVDAAETSG